MQEYDGISLSQHLEMYDWFISRLNSNSYKALFASLLNDLINGRKQFEEKDILTQSKILMEILKAFKCDSQRVSLKNLNGKNEAGIIMTSNNLSSAKKAYLINQSVTGLYEYKVDLLK